MPEDLAGIQIYNVQSPTAAALRRVYAVFEEQEKLIEFAANGRHGTVK